MKKLSDAQTIITIENKQFILNEMKVRRVSEFGIKAIKIVNEFQGKSKGKGKGNKSIRKMEIEQAFIEYGDLAFERLAEILNWLFSYKNPDYISTTQEWFEENLSIREITLIGEEVARQNQIKWLTDFFQMNFSKALQTLKS